MEVAVNAAYAALQLNGQYSGAVWQVGEVRSDNTWNWEGGGNLPDAEIDQFKETATNNILDAMWLDHYQGILLCNTVLSRIAAVNMDEQLQNRFRGEVLFLRALMYFNLVRTFGEVPLVLEETRSITEGYAHKRETVNKVYAQIVADLKLASNYLPVSYTWGNIGRATQGAAKSLLGKVYLTISDFHSAASVLKEVIDAGSYKLLGSYADLWRANNANHAESIFEVQYKKGGTGTGSPFQNMFAPRDSELFVTIVGFAYGRNLPTSDLIASYENGDVRKMYSLAETYIRRGTEVYDPFTIKYRDVPYSDSDADNNWPVLRYADVMLMYAEALNEINSGPVKEAYDMIDAVRARARLDPLPQGMDQFTFSMAIERERRAEFAFEGHRWFDLVRTGRALAVMNAHFGGAPIIQSYQLLFPVPQRQININPSVITQNSGYE